MNDMKKSLFNKRVLARALMMVLDAVTVNFAYFMALVLRYYVAFGFNPYAERFVETFLNMAPWYGIGCVAVFCAFRLYNVVWSFGGFRDLNRILLACIVTSLI